MTDSTRVLEAIADCVVVPIGVGIDSFVPTGLLVDAGEAVVDPLCVGVVAVDGVAGASVAEAVACRDVEAMGVCVSVPVLDRDADTVDDLVAVEDRVLARVAAADLDRVVVGAGVIDAEPDGELEPEGDDEAEDDVVRDGGGVAEIVAAAVTVRVRVGATLRDELEVGRAVEVPESDIDGDSEPDDDDDDVCVPLTDRDGVDDTEGDGDELCELDCVVVAEHVGDVVDVPVCVPVRVGVPDDVLDDVPDDDAVNDLVGVLVRVKDIDGAYHVGLTGAKATPRKIVPCVAVASVATTRVVVEYSSSAVRVVAYK